MAGKVRQAIDEAAFAKFVGEKVPQIKTPMELKQVSDCSSQCAVVSASDAATASLALASRTRRTW